MLFSESVLKFEYYSHLKFEKSTSTRSTEQGPCYTHNNEFSENMSRNATLRHCWNSNDFQTMNEQCSSGNEVNPSVVLPAAPACWTCMHNNIQKRSDNVSQDLGEPQNMLGGPTKLPLLWKKLFKDWIRDVATSCAPKVQGERLWRHVGRLRKQCSTILPPQLGNDDLFVDRWSLYSSRYSRTSSLCVFAQHTPSQMITSNWWNIVGGNSACIYSCCKPDN